MKILKGQRIVVKDTRKGRFFAIAKKDFDTVNDEWYPCILDQNILYGLSNEWRIGDEVPARRGLCHVELRGGE